MLFNLEFRCEILNTNLEESRFIISDVANTYFIGVYRIWVLTHIQCELNLYVETFFLLFKELTTNFVIIIHLMFNDL